MTVHNIVLHLLPVLVFAVFLLILFFVCRKADSRIISRFSSRRSSQASLASRKSSLTPRQCAINLISNGMDPEVSVEKMISDEPAFV